MRECLVRDDGADCARERCTSDFAELQPTHCDARDQCHRRGEPQLEGDRGVFVMSDHAHCGHDRERPRKRAYTDHRNVEPVIRMMHALRPIQRGSAAEHTRQELSPMPTELLNRSVCPAEPLPAV